MFPCQESAAGLIVKDGFHMERERDKVAGETVSKFVGVSTLIDSEYALKTRV